MAGYPSRARTPRHAVLAVVCSAALLFGIAFGAAAPAVADTVRGTVSGTLTVAGAVPKEWGAVTALRYDAKDDSYDEVRSAQMDPADGSYSLSLAPGTYRLRFDAQWAVTQYFPAAARVWAADDVVVAPGGMVTANADLAARSGIYGQLTGSEGYFTRRAMPSVTAVNTSTHLHAVADRLSDGSYFIGGRQTGSRGGLTTGSYRLDINRLSGPSSYVAEYYPDIAESDGPAGATPVDYTLGDVVTGKDVALQTGATLQGTITTAGGAAARCVLTARRVGPDSYVARSDRSGRQGAFSITGLNPGDYRLTASRCWADGAEGATFAYDGDATLSTEASSAVATVAADQTLTLADTLVLPVRGAADDLSVEVSGHLTRPAGTGSVTVALYRVLDGRYQHLGSDATRSGGNYSLWGVAGGTYVVAFQRVTAQTLLAAQLYDGKPDAAGLDGATRFTLPTDTPDGTPYHLSDATIVEGGHFTGTLTSTGSVPLAHCYVTARPVVHGMAARYDRTGTDGSFDIGGLSDGDYRISVAGGACTRSPRWLAGGTTLVRKRSEAAALTAHLGVATTLGGLVESLRGTISGHVTLPDTPNRNDRRVQLINLATGWTVRSTEVGDDGTYHFGRLGSGSYVVAFARISGTTLAAQYWNGLDESVGTAGADPIQVAQGQDVTGIDATLSAGATISGTVTDSSGTPLADCEVRAEDPSGVLHSSAGSTDDAGTFTLVGLSTGSFHLVVSGGQGACPSAGSQWLADTDGTLGTFGTATSVPLTAGQTATLPQPLVYVAGATITGAIKISDDLPKNRCWACYNFNAHLDVVDLATGDVVAHRDYDKLDDDGRTFTVAGLAPGSYRLDFNRSSQSSWLAPSYFANVPETSGSDAAQVITVGSGETFHGGTQTMQFGGTIAGHVVDADGNPLRCTVDAFAPDGSLSSRLAYSDQRRHPGQFADRGLASASYDLGVRCYTDEDYYDWMYYTGPDGHLTTDITHATPIAATLGTTVTLPSALVYDPHTTPVIANTVAPSVGGTARVGATLTADPGGWLPTPDGFTYQWLRDGTPIDGATSSTYDVVPGDLDHTLAVEVTAQKAGYDPASLRSDPTAQVVPGELTASTTPSITGTAQVGSKLTGAKGVWEPTPDSYSYRWLADGTAIAGATGTSYTLTPAEQGKQITFEVTAARTGFDNAVATSTATAAVVPLQFSAVGAPTITGTARIGATLTGKTGTWTPTPSYSYRWLADGTAIIGATGTTYVLTAAEEGKKITFEVTGTKAGYATAMATSAETSAVAPQQFGTVGTPTISGNAAVGETLTATAGSWSPAPDSLSYQWYADGTAIDAATGTSYVLTAAEQGAVITVTVSGMKAHYETATATSAPTAAVSDGTFADTVAPSISGRPKVGSTLTADPGGWSLSDLSFAYQWSRNGAPIAGATAPTYLLTAADAGASIAVSVTASRSGYGDSTAASSTVTVAKLVSKTKLAGSKKVKAKKKVTFTITVAGAGVVNPTGKVVVRDASKKLTTLTLTARKHGKITVKLALKKGKHKLTVSYGGSATVAPSTSAKLTVTAK